MSHRALRHIEESPWTRNLKHLRSIARVKPLKIPKSLTRNTQLFPVPLRDRIKQWNIVPGDHIRIRGDRDGTVREVFGINKFRNLVFLRAPQDTETTETEPPQMPSVPYSKCQLYVGDREFPPAPGETAPRVLPVFASRIGCSAPRYVVSLGRFDWERFAVQTIPRLGNRTDKVKISIPWPKPETIPPPPIEAYDTPEEVVKEITWRPSPISYPPSTYAKAKLLQDAYFHSIRHLPRPPPVPEYDQATSPPIEYALRDELSNPNSRAKKQFRERKRRAELKVAHARFLENELSDLEGRTRKEALVEAEWKWREHLRVEERKWKRSQWVLRGAAAKLRRKRQRKARKARREVENLKNLTLEPGPNQVIPSTLTTAQS